MMKTFEIPPVEIQTITGDWLAQKGIGLDVLRLDKIHPVVSGNKSFKLKYYLQQAISQQKTTVATFGGAWSNHIVATAYACKLMGLSSIGFIRGEELTELSATLAAAKECGMKLYFVSREEYRDKENIQALQGHTDRYWIPEGGYGILGAKGASEILASIDVEKYTHIIAAVGTGTMLAGLTKSATINQKVIGISCMKGNPSLQHQVAALLSDESKEGQFEIIHDYHFGGFGRHPPSLIAFMNDIYTLYQIPLDIVYTGKTFFAVKDLIEKDFFSNGNQLLIIHSGGLQGNSSLGDKVLTF